MPKPCVWAYDNWLATYDKCLANICYQLTANQFCSGQSQSQTTTTVANNMGFSCANSQCNKEYGNKWSLHLHQWQSPLYNPSSQSFPVGIAGPFGDFDLSDMDLSLTSLCEGSNNVQELLMDISFPLSGDSSCVGSAGSGGSSFSGGGSISVGSGSGISSGSGIGVSGGSSSVSGGSGRGVGGGGSKGGSINNSIEGGGSVVVVIADPPPDIDSDSDDKFFDALSNSHCVKCQIEYLGSHFDHCDLDSESGQSSDESELDDNGLDEFVEQNTVDEIYSPLSTKRSQSITKHKCKSCTKNTNSYMRFYLIPIHKPS